MSEARLTIEGTGLVSSTVRRFGVRGVVCRVASGPDAGASVQVGGRPVCVGADAGCDLILSDDKVSRHHLELHVVAEGIRVRDLDSTNGTHYQGSRIGEAVVPVGGSIGVGNSTLKLEAVSTPTIAPSPRNSYGGLAGDSSAMREIFSILVMAAPTDATVLIEGESGTGKELIARALHDHSERADGPMVVVDCSATAEALIDSQLFGHVKGAFTGAVADRPGAFVRANGGTLFLDEIGELPLPQQAKLLRALEEKTVQPVGSDQRVQLETRVVAATHRDLPAMVEQGSFRFDLYHRLAVVHVKVPALRERLEDLPILVEHFYRGRDFEPGPIEGDNLARLRNYAWPGNVRELRNVLERAWVLTPPGERAFASLNLWLSTTSEPRAQPAADLGLPFKEAKERIINEFERRYLTALWARCDYNVTRAAEHAGLNRKTFRELLQKHGIQRP